MHMGEFKHWHGQGRKEGWYNLTWQAAGDEAVPAVCNSYSFSHRK